MNRLKPILFSTEMVRAILAGRKTQTRRVITHGKSTPLSSGREKFYEMVDTLNGKQFYGTGFYKDSDIFEYEGETHIDAVYFKSRYRSGDILYVKETWRLTDYQYIDGTWSASVQYKADMSCGPRFFWKDGSPEEKKYERTGWRSSRYMPRAAARIFLRVTDVRVERLQDITPEDCVLEGAAIKYFPRNSKPWIEVNAIDKFSYLWNALNAKRGYGWDTNPWVWVYTFERVEEP